MGVFLTKNRNQHIRASHLFLAIRCALNMHDGALNNPLETQRGLRVHFILTGHHRGVVLDEILQVLSNFFDIA